MYAGYFDGEFKDANERLMSVHKKLVASLDGTVQTENSIAVSESHVI